MRRLLFHAVLTTGILILQSLLVVGQLVSPTSKSKSQSNPKIENPAALANFFAALKSSRTGSGLEPLRIMHFGDSHTAADILTAAVRHRFQTQFGDGGPGFIVPGNPMSTRRPDARSGTSAGWVVEGIGSRIAPDHIYGPAGIALSTNQPNQTAWLETVSSHFEVFFVRQPTGGSIDITMDGASLVNAPISLVSRVAGLGHASFDEPSNTVHRFEIRTVNPGKVRLLGIVGEQLHSGVVYDVLGVNGARASRLLDWNQSAFSAFIAQRAPNLIILAFGTNEAGDQDWSQLVYEQELTTILRRLHAAAPKSSILVWAPPDRADQQLAARRIATIVEVQRRAAFAGNAAFWSGYDAMGGAGSMRSWVARGLGQADQVHLTTAGYVHLADQFFADLIRAFATRVASRSTTPQSKLVGNHIPRR